MAVTPFTPEYYLGLLTSQYYEAAKLQAWLGVLLAKGNDIQVCLNSFTAAFDLDTAVGAQLAIIGQITGVPKTVGFQPSNGVSPVLDDTTYRLLIRATIAQNHWDGTIDGLQSTWQDLFPGGRINVDDTQNMAATIILSGAFTSITKDLIVNGYIVPRPQGVLYNFVFPVLPALGFDQNTAYVAGFDLGHWT